MFFKSIILFFTGRSLDDALPEDKKAKEIKEGRPASAAGPIFEQPVYTNNSYTQQVPPQPAPQPTTIEEAVFGQSEERIPHEDEIEPAPAPQPVEEERSTDEIFESILMVVSPILLFGTFTILSKEISSFSFMSKWKYAKTSLISLL